YEAISYVWGDETFPQPILVNGRFLAIRRNLHNALYHLRHPRESGRRRTLWVDALCINQSDMHERNHQISLMRNIFSNARQVIAWLGE
ncbi:HET-domain-containing protein, partial [Canariomyces notabilis]